MNMCKAILTLTTTVALARANWSGNTHPKADPHPPTQIYYPAKPKPYLKVLDPLHQRLETTYAYHDAPRTIYREPLQRPDYHSDPFQGLKLEPATHPTPKVRHKHNTIGSGSDTEGFYHVLLPDGRTQTVEFHVDDAQSLVGTGFDASPLRSFRAVR